MSVHRYGRLIAAAAAALLITLTACSSPDNGQGGPNTGGQKLKIALSNSFIGNQWRVEMENVFKAACAMPPYLEQVECSIYNAGNDVSTQSRQIANLISQGVNGIVINAASTSGLNGVVQQACDRGIVVVSFDNTVDAPCGLTVNTDQVKFGKQLAQFIVDELNGQGNVVMVTGVAGTGADNDRNKGAKEVFAKNADIKIIARARDDRHAVKLYGLGAKAEAFREAYASWGAWIILIKGLTPIPYKLDHRFGVRALQLRGFRAALVCGARHAVLRGRVSAQSLWRAGAGHSRRAAGILGNAGADPARRRHHCRGLYFLDQARHAAFGPFVAAGINIFVGSIVPQFRHLKFADYNRIRGQ